MASTSLKHEIDALLTPTPSTGGSQLSMNSCQNEKELSVSVSQVFCAKKNTHTSTRQVTWSHPRPASPFHNHQEHLGVVVGGGEETVDKFAALVGPQVDGEDPLEPGPVAGFQLRERPFRLVSCHLFG